jgi:hypothetical protein
VETIFTDSGMPEAAHREFMNAGARIEIVALPGKRSGKASD